MINEKTDYEGIHNTFPQSGTYNIN